MNHPIVTVVMSVYNGEEHVHEAVDSILNQTFTDFEFIIIDDGSTDSSAHIVERYQRADERIRVISYDNVRLARALNRGVSLARGEWIAYQDPAHVSMPTRLEAQLQFVADHPDVGALCALIETVNRGGACGAVHGELDHARILFYLLRCNPFNHGSMMFSSEVFERVGGYDEDLRYAREYDLLWRMSRHTTLASLASPVCRRRQPEVETTGSKEYEEALEEDRVSVRNCLHVINDSVRRLQGAEAAQFADVSAVICTKDRYSDVVRCICHVLIQTKVPREIVIVDASTDRSVEEMLADTVDVAVPVVRYVRARPGLTHQRNVGIRNSTGSIILFLDDDIVLYPEFVRGILRVFDEAQGDIGGVMGDIVNSRAHMEARHRALVNRIFFSYSFGDGSFKRSGASTAPYGLAHVKEVEFLCGGQTAWRREVCEEFWFDESFPDEYCYGEDVEFSYRVSRKYKNYYTPYARSFHNNRTSLKKHHPTVYRSMKIRNHSYHFRKNVPKTPLNVAAFALSMFHLKHQPRLYRIADVLAYLGKRFRSERKLEFVIHMLFALKRRFRQAMSQ